MIINDSGICYMLNVVYVLSRYLSPGVEIWILLLEKKYKEKRKKKECPFGEMSKREIPYLENVHPVGEMSIQWGKCPSGNCPSENCPRFHLDIIIFYCIIIS